MRHFSRATRAATSLALLATCAVGSLRGQEPSGEIRIARLVKQLGANDYADRQQASEALDKLGPQARAELEQATRDADPEVRLEAKELLRGLKLQELWAARRAKFTTGEQPASKLLATLGEQTGNRILTGDQYGAFHEQVLPWKHQDLSFWEAMDEICLASGNRVRPNYDSRQPGLVVIAAKASKFPMAYSGPIRGQVINARRVFSEDLDYETLASERQHTFQLGLQMMWEDRFQAVAYRSQPELVSATTDTGQNLAATQTSASAWNVVSSGSRQVTTTLRLQPPPTGAKELDTLKLRWGLIAVSDLATLELPAVAGPQPHFQDDVELIVDSIQRGTGGRCEVELSFMRELVIPDPQEVLFQENEVELFDEQGRPFRRQGQTNNLTETGAKLKLSFLGESGESVPKTLKFVYPRIRSQRDVEIVFRHVPLPTGRPE